MTELVHKSSSLFLSSANTISKTTQRNNEVTTGYVLGDSTVVLRVYIMGKQTKIHDVRQLGREILGLNSVKVGPVVISGRVNIPQILLFWDRLGSVNDPQINAWKSI